MRVAKLVLGAFLLVTTVVVAGCAGGPVLRGWSGATAEGSTLFLGTRDGRIVSVSAASDNLQWSAPLETGTQSSGLGCARAPIIVSMYGSPAVSGNMVFVGGYNGKVYSFVPGEAQPDRILSSVRFNNKDVTIGPIVGTITAAGGNLFFGSSDGRVYAVNERLQPVWSQPFATGGKIWSSPAVSNGTVYVGSFDKHVYALDESTGSEKWRFEVGGALVASPVVSGDTLYVAGFDRTIYALDASSGSLKWTFAAGQSFWATPVVANGAVYAPCLDGKLYVLDAVTGASLNVIKLGSAVSSSPVIDGNTVFVCTQQSPSSNGVGQGAAVWAIDTTTRQGKELARVSGQQVYAPLAVDGGGLFVHTNADLLYRVDTVTGAVTQITIKSS